MTVGWLAENAFAELKRNDALLRSIAGANEATTRLRAIDTILFDVLRWDKTQVEAELYSRDTGYSDYAFGPEPTFSLVLEAKREGIGFTLADRIPSDRPVPFDLLANESPDAASALRQATGYAVQLGAVYAAISNGHQWLLAMTFVSGRPIDSRYVIAFPGLDHIIQNFRYFWETFSPLAISQFTPTSKLLENRFDPPPAKLSTRIGDYPQPAGRNVLRDELSPLIEPIWSRVTQDDKNDDFLQRCYIKPEDEGEELELASHLLSTGKEAQERLDADPAAIPALRVAELFDKTAIHVTKPIVLLGRIGHGKSIFLQYLRKIHAATVLRDYIQIDIDFLDRPDTKGEVPNYIYNELDRHLLDGYGIDIKNDKFARAALRNELLRFGTSTRGEVRKQDPERFALAEADWLDDQQKDRHSYCAVALRHLKRSHHKALAIFFDNLDRQTDEIQEAAFLQASSIARDWQALVFICLRPSTFQRSRTTGVLDTVAPRIMTVSPPDTGIMLKRRFEYASALAKIGADFAGVSDPDSKHPIASAADFRRLARFFEICGNSFSRNKQLSSLFGSVANGNARFVLYYVQMVIRSGHLNTQKILEIATDSGGYTIAPHEALRALLFGDHKQYDPSSSPFCNLFDIEHSEPREHFTRILTLDYFARAAVGDKSYGYRVRGDVENYLHSMGYIGPHVTSTLRFLYDHKCLEGRSLDSAFDDVGPDLRMTELGRYHVADLVRTFVYLDAIVVDTPILDHDVRLEVTNVEDLSRRLSRSRAFLRYLNRCAEELQDTNARNLWNDINDAVMEDITSLEPESA